MFSQNIKEVFQESLASIESTIEMENESYILNVNETAYAEHLESKYRKSAPEILFDNVVVDGYDGDVPAERFPQTFDVYPGRTYKKQIIQYFIPCIGDVQFLNYCPSTFVFWGRSNSFQIRKNELVLELINFSNNPEEIKRIYENEVNTLQRNYLALRNEIAEFNGSLNAKILVLLNKRKRKILEKNNLLSSLGVKLKVKDGVANTFSIPKPQLREKVVVKPSVSESGFKPEPALDEKNYQNILKLINDVGKNFERLPSIYKGKGEEDLRDHILLVLDPNFEFGSASGETFNKSGKTDIQLRYDSSVVFIAECKFWAGEKQFLSTIDQLLGYLTWRDTKASVIVFVTNKEFSLILNKIKPEAAKHPNYLSYVGNSDVNWFNFRFHINGDRNREVKIAIQLYHIPK